MIPTTSSRTARALLAIFTATVLVLSVGMLAAGASAQTVPGAGNETTPQGTEVTDQLGDLVIHSYSYDDGEFSINATWRGDMPEELTITEMIELDQEGSTKISFKRVRLIPDDRTTITVAAEKRDGTAALLLTTPQSVEANDALVLQSGDGVDRGPVPFNYATLLIGLAAVGGAGMAFTLTAKNYLEDEDTTRRERIA